MLSVPLNTNQPISVLSTYMYRYNFQYFCMLLLFRDVRDRERRYLSEAGCRAFDEVRRLYVAKRIQMVDPSVQRLSERVVSESDLVVDVCGVLIGLPSRSFRWSCHDSSPVGFSVYTRLLLCLLILERFHFFRVFL